jgi:hypothetical protein
LRLATLVNAHTTQSTNFPIAVTCLTFSIQLSFTTNGVSMAAPLTTCTKEEQLAAVIRFWGGRWVGVRDDKSMEDHEHSSVTMFCLSEKRGIGWTCSKISEQTSVKNGDEGARLHGLLKRTLNKFVRQFTAEGGWQSMRRQTSCRLVTVLSMKPSTPDTSVSHCRR